MSPRLPHRSTIGAALALTLAALLAITSPAFAISGDLRSPDARDAGGVVVVSSPQDDQRSPDARAAGQAAPPTVAPPRSPEHPVPITRIVTVDAPAAPNGFEWTDAAIGAAAALGFALVLAGGVALVSRRQRAAHGGIATS